MSDGHRLLLFRSHHHESEAKKRFVNRHRNSTSTMASSLRISSLRRSHSSHFRHQEPMIPSRPLSLRFVPFLRQPQPVLTHRAFSTTPNTSSSTTRQLLTSFRRTLQEGWSVLQVTLPQPSEWKASCLTLTQQQDNRVARSLLQLHKEVHLLQYHGPRKYFFEQNNYPYQLLPSSWTTYFSRNVLEDEQPSASQQKSTTNSAQSSSHHHHHLLQAPSPRCPLSSPRP